VAARRARCQFALRLMYDPNRHGMARPGHLLQQTNFNLRIQAEVGLLYGGIMGHSSAISLAGVDGLKSLDKQ
jgi:hypothetical protein